MLHARTSVRLVMRIRRSSSLSGKPFWTPSTHVWCHTRRVLLDSFIDPDFLDFRDFRNNGIKPRRISLVVSGCVRSDPQNNPGEFWFYNWAGLLVGEGVKMDESAARKAGGYRRRNGAADSRQRPGRLASRRHAAGGHSTGAARDRRELPAKCATRERARG